MLQKAVEKVQEKPTIGDYKFQKRFAWMPTKVREGLIWLQPYYECLEYGTRMELMLPTTVSLPVTRWRVIGKFIRNGR